MAREPFRIMPKMGPGAYQTYQIDTPLATHYRDADCREVDCRFWRDGWTRTIEPATPKGDEQEAWIRQSGRRFTAHRDGPYLTFTFYPEQRCFTRHRIKTDKPEIYTVARGDFRARDTPRTMRGVDWVEHFGEHQERLADQIRRG